MLQWVYLSVAIAAEVTGTSFLKSSQGFTRPGPSAIVTVLPPRPARSRRTVTRPRIGAGSGTFTKRTLAFRGLPG